MFLIQKQWLHFYYKAIRCFANEQDVVAKLEMEAKMESKRIKSFWRPTNGGWGCQKEHSGKREFCKRLFSLRIRLEVIGSILTHPLYTTSSWERATDWRRTDLGIRDKVRETIIFKEFFLFLKQKKNVNLNTTPTNDFMEYSMWKRQLFPPIQVQYHYLHQQNRKLDLRASI